MIKFIIISQIVHILWCSRRWQVYGVMVYCIWTCMIGAQAQNLGYPTVNNFAPSDFQGGTQTWRLDMSVDGIIYAANNDGLLVFDGHQWEVYPLPNRTIARSLDFYRDTIFIGGQDELGYFLKNPQGDYSYHSLWNSIPKSQRNITDIWDLFYLDNQLYFRNHEDIFFLKKDSFGVIYPQARSYFLTMSDGLLLFQVMNEGIYSLDTKNNFQLIHGTKEIANQEIIHVCKRVTDTLIFTADQGIYELNNNRIKKWNTNANDFLEENVITTALVMDNGQLAVGTQLGGVVVIAPNGHTRYIIDRELGLQNNNVTSIVEDLWSNLWVGTYFGIDRINLGSGMNTFYPDEELEGAVYDIAIFQDKIWFATTNGLYSYPYESYHSPFENIQPSLVKGTKGQVWALDLIDDQLMVGHHNGTFTVIGDEVVNELDIEDGTWKFIKLDEKHLAVGCYEGIYVFEKRNNRWIRLFKINDFDESSRVLSIDRAGNLWISHPYRAVYKIQFNHDYSSYKISTFSQKDGLECATGNYIFNIDGEAIVSNPCGIFRFISSQNKFVRDTSFESIIGLDQRAIRFFQDEKGVWFIAENETGLIKGLDFEKNHKEAQKILFPHMGKDYVGGFEHFLPINENHILFSTNRGVRIYEVNEYSSQPTLKPIITRCEVNSSEVRALQEVPLPLSPNENNLTFQFRTNGLIPEDFKGYLIQLEGYETGWALTEIPQKSYNNLPAGEYTFNVRILGNQEIVSPIESLSFEIHEKWYDTLFARLSFFSAILLAFVLIFFIPRRKYQKNTAELVDKQQKTEEELQVVKEERLQDEIRFKTQELASVTLHLIQKKQTIDTLKEEMKRIQKKAADSAVRKDIHNINKLLKADDRLEDDWERFTILFDQVHIDFMQRLKETYPQLTPKDQKLSAFLRMNLSTKEIAPLMNISVRGVEISRYRLRKKLNLHHDINLSDFMINF